MAVREGFEPSIGLQTLYSLSRGAPSATRPPHLDFLQQARPRANLRRMARVEGFEPPTAWFVARYSIQLSYTRAENTLNTKTTNRSFKNMARVEGFEPPTAWFVARYSIQLSYTRTGNTSIKKAHITMSFLNNGARGRIRTSDRLVRSQVLYPAELHARRKHFVIKTINRSFKIWRAWKDSNLRPPGS